VPADEEGWRQAGLLHGNLDEIREELRRWAEAGIERVMLQMLDQDDLAAVDLIAREVLPALR
jgi:hypothetical protein